MAERNVYVVTGGAGGIGLACAKQFKGGIVMISDVAPAALEKGKAALEAEGIEAVAKVCDISDRAQVAEMAKEAAALGKVKGVVHSAAVSGDCGKMDLVLRVDLLGTYYILEEFLNVMGKDSSMVLIASMMADTIPPHPERDALLLDPGQEGIVEKLSAFCDNNANLAYDITKRGVRLLASAYASAYGKKGARINSVSPGVIMTEMAKLAAEEHPETMRFMESVSPLGRNGEPEEIADVVAYLCSDKASLITGIDIKADGGTMNAVIEYKRKAAQSQG